MMTDIPEFFDQKPVSGNPSTEELHQLVELINKTVPKILDYISMVKAQPELTPEDEIQLEKMNGYLQKLTPIITILQQKLGNKLFQQSSAFYFHLKELAEKGDPTARKIYEELKPYYQESIREQLENN